MAIKESLKDINHEGKTKRKTPLQLECLERLYSENRYPSQTTMEDATLSLKLTYKQVRGWFVEKRRRDKLESSGTKDIYLSSRRNQLQLLPSKKPTRFSSCDQQYHVKGKNSNHVQGYTNSSKKGKLKPKVTAKRTMLPLDFILKKVFRKDGPPLGVKFDPLPAGAFDHDNAGPTYAPRNTHYKRATKKRKVLYSTISDSEVHTKRSAPVPKHGMGKGLMTAWRATNPGAGAYPGTANSTDRDIADNHLSAAHVRTTKPLPRKVKKSQPKPSKKQGSKKGDATKKLLQKKNRAIRNAKVSSKNAKNTKNQEKCKLALEGLRSHEYPSAISNLVDDEELELRELQAGPNPMTCSAHLANEGIHSCSLCKDLLAKFPPNCVKMKRPLCGQPWGSSPELVKKLFKVFRFLYSHSGTFDIGPFTLDEFAQAFHDKDSELLGKIHVAVLKVLFSDLEMQLSSGSFPHASKNYRFIAFLHSVKQQEFILNTWNICLNSVTWIEILRQVMVAAGFNSKQSTFMREHVSEDEKHLVECGLRPRTLKGEVFSILAEQGSTGSRVSELAKSLRVADLNLTNTTEELEILICSTLSSDITLFEKISSSAYRLRSNLLTNKEVVDYKSDSEDSGSVELGGQYSITNSSDESELDSSRTSLSIVKHKQHSAKKRNMLTEDTEIDESDSGELWMLALMEGEYSDLSFDEKLSTLVALVDLTSFGSSTRVETTRSVVAESVSTIQHHGGAKIKRSLGKHDYLSKPYWDNGANMNIVSEKKGAEEVELHGHPLYSIYLGSDRRFNSYWLFLGPCNAKDEGHRRIYFESSEDGHWEVIDTKEALCSLLSVLDGRGSRESRLVGALERLETLLCEGMSTNMISDTDTRQSALSDQSCIDAISGDGSSPSSVVDNNSTFMETVNESFTSIGDIGLELKKVEKWDRLQAFDAWIWNSFYSNLNAVKHHKRSFLDTFVRCVSCHDLYWRDEKHCKICHTTFELDFDLEERYAIHVVTCRESEEISTFPRHKVLPSQLQSLKAALHAIEGAMPREALVSAWTTSDHKLWATRLKRTSSLSEFLQVLTDFVGAINEEWLCKCNRSYDCSTAPNEMLESFTTMPQTTSAVALWLVKLDTLIFHHFTTSIDNNIQQVSDSSPEPQKTRKKRKLAQG
ncbi:hypothetical protein ACHQM5_019902 [Ranunculus cassubicifolius]